MIDEPSTSGGSVVWSFSSGEGQARLAPTGALAYLVSVRKERGVSQSAIGSRLGLQQPGMSSLENGRVGVRLEQIIQYAEALGLTVTLEISGEE